ncbi:MAG: AbrB family transcriptional regulator [Chloroflexi bacterium]|nr:AbrB family transcriptional regulator [Chloroflexota bacterium]
MKEIVSTVTSKGQVTIPADVRRHLRVVAHDKIAFVIEDTGAVHVKARQYSTIASLRGAAGALKRPLSWKEMRHIAREDALAPNAHP